MWTFHVLYVHTDAFHNFLDMMQHTINPDTYLGVGNCSKVQIQLVGCDCKTKLGLLYLEN